MAPGGGFPWGRPYYLVGTIHVALAYDLLEDLPEDPDQQHYRNQGNQNSEAHKAGELGRVFVDNRRDFHKEDNREENADHDADEFTDLDRPAVSEKSEVALHFAVDVHLSHYLGKCNYCAGYQR